MRFEVVKVTPRMAESLLQKNTINRPLRAGHVDTLAGAMRRGEWRSTHQGLALSKKGNLLDGQHRLNAVILCGLTIEMLIVKDVPDEVFDTLDIGARRSAADVLGADVREAAAAAYMIKLTTPDIRGSITPQMLFPALVAWRPYYEMVVGNGNGARARSMASASVKCAAMTKIADGENAAYVHGVYGSLVHRDFDAMPPVARTLFRQHLDGLKASGIDMFARALTVFTESKSSMTRIQVTTTDTAMKYVRQVHQDVMDGKEKARKNTGPKVAKVKPDYIAA